MKKLNLVRGLVTLLITLGILIPQGVVFADAPSTPVTVELSVVPFGGKGGTAQVVCKVTSTLAINNLNVNISARGASFLSVNSWRGSTSKNEASEYRTTMLLAKEGNISVTCTAMGPNRNGTRWGDSKTLYFNVGPETVSKGWSMARNFQSGQAKLLDESAPELENAVSGFDNVAFRPGTVLPPGIEKVKISTGSEATTCYRGRWYFYDRGTYAPPADHTTAASRALMALRPLVWSTIWLYDDDGATGDDYLGAALTDENGYWNFCATNPQADGDYIDLYIKAGMANSWFDVSTSTSYNPYYWQTGAGVATWSNTSGASFNTGIWYIPNTSTNLLGVWAFNDLVKSYWYFTSPRRVNYGPSEVNIEAYVIGGFSSRTKWSPSSTDGTYYSFSDDTIHLKGTDPRTYSAGIHEWAHRLMNVLYGADSNWPTGYGGCPSPHYYGGVSGRSCAWSEGWADAVSILVPNDPIYRWASGSTANNETRAGFSAGDSVEGNVAAVFWDWMDKTNDGVSPNNDYVQLPFDSFLMTFNVNDDDDMFLHFWNDWKASGEWCSPALSALRASINTAGYSCP
jgi:hypothetical protein